MPKTNYRFEKRQREMAKQKKKQQKLRRKADKTSAPTDNAANANRNQATR